MNDELLFAFVEAWLKRQKPKERMEYLRDVAEIIDNWPKEPIPIRGGRPAQRLAAAEQFRARLPRLLG